MATKMGVLHLVGPLEILILVISLSIGLSSSLAMEAFHERRQYGTYGSKPVLRKITVCPDQGHCDFTSVQAAINSVPKDNPGWICIRILPGLYREKVTVDKPYLLLKGDGKKKTQIVWDDHENLHQSPTFTVVVDNFVAMGISFVNSYNLPRYGGHRSARVPAAAAYISGDKCSFYRCGFIGVQDTLWDVQGRHYFYQSMIIGSVDFILGTGQSLYENCDIFVWGGVLEHGTAGFITSQKRDSPNDSSGFVFKGCKIFGDGAAYLGRPWGPYARVLFYKSSMSGIVVRQGWDPWKSAGEEYKLTFAEAECEGPGADKTRRVEWEQELGEGEIEKLTSLSYINSDRWIEEQPIHLHSIHYS